MNNEDLFNALINLQKLKGQFSKGSDLYFYIDSHKELQKIIYILSKKLLDRQLGSCMSCYMDSFIQLMRIEPEVAKKKLECLFRLKDGKLLYGTPNVSNGNITNELALQHLLNEPECKQWFDILPPNLDELLDEYKASLEPKKEEVKETIEEEKKVSEKPKKVASKASKKSTKNIKK